MKHQVLHIYALAVCLVGAVGLAIAVAVSGYALVRLAAPSITLPNYLNEQLATTDSFLRSRTEHVSDRLAERYLDMNEAELEAARTEEMRRALAEQQRQGIQTLISCAIFILVFAVLFVLHWRLARSTAAKTGA